MGNSVVKENIDVFLFWPSKGKLSGITNNGRGGDRMSVRREPLPQLAPLSIAARITLIRFPFLLPNGES